MTRRDPPRVAVILATIGRPELVAGAIETVCDQTYEAVELVIVDGSDDDRTEAVVERARRAESNVPMAYIHNEEPQGLPAARNQACAETDAPYVAFLDDDDRWDPTKIERQVSVFRAARGDLGLVHTGVTFVERDGSHRGTHTPSYEPPPYPELLTQNLLSTPSCVVVDREAFEAVGEFDESMRYCEDWDLYIRIAREYEVDYVPDRLVDRVMHDDAMTENSAEMIRYEKRVLTKHERELRAHGVYDEAWSLHHRRTGRRHLRNEEFPQAAAAFRNSWTANGRGQCLLLYLVIVFTPSAFTVPVIERLNAAKRFALDLSFDGIRRSGGDAKGHPGSE